MSWGVSEADTSSRVLLLKLFFSGGHSSKQDRPRSRPWGRSNLRSRQNMSKNRKGI